MLYQTECLPSVKNDLSVVSKVNKTQIRKAIEKKLGINPVEFGKPLQLSLKGCVVSG